jgi:hypothetical protein
MDSSGLGNAAADAAGAAGSPDGPVLGVGGTGSLEVRNANVSVPTTIASATSRNPPTRRPEIEFMATKYRSGGM